MLSIPQRVDSAHTIEIAYVTPPSEDKCPSSIFLDALLCHFLFEVTSDNL